MAVVATREAKSPSMSISTWHFFVAKREMRMEVQPPPIELITVTTADLDAIRHRTRETPYVVPVLKAK